MKKIIYFLITGVLFTCQNNKQNSHSTPTTPDKEHTPTVIVYDTIKKEWNQGQQLLFEARRQLSLRKNQQFDVKLSENEKMAKLLLQYIQSDELTEEELLQFLMINPNDLTNSAELSQMYNEALFKVVQSNNKMFAKQLVKEPQLSQKLSFEFKNPVNDDISKDLIIRNTLNEYQIQVDNRINGLENKDLIMQYYIEKKKVFRELDGKESDIKAPQKIQEINKAEIDGFERDYKIENRLPDEGIGFVSQGSGINILKVGGRKIELKGVKVDLNKFESENLLEQSINQNKLKEIQKTIQLQEN